jgi:hypothetical protein
LETRDRKASANLLVKSVRRRLDQRERTRLVARGPHTALDALAERLALRVHLVEQRRLIPCISRSSADMSGDE